MRLLGLAVLSLLALALATPAAAVPPEEHQDEPCIPEDIFDRTCGQTGDVDHCSGNCKECTTRDGVSGCWTVYWAAQCTCGMDMDDNGEMFCDARGSCSVWL